MRALSYIKQVMDMDDIQFEFDYELYRTIRNRTKNDSNFRN